tara:strand:+ start:996 stop:1166 length:171 start_codon:yes stop_codon:yes gene_type:complete
MVFWENVKVNIVKKEDFKKWADIVRSEQLSTREVVELFEENKEFSAWYFTTYKTPR